MSVTDELNFRPSLYAPRLHCTPCTLPETWPRRWSWSTEIPDESRCFPHSRDFPEGMNSASSFHASNDLWLQVVEPCIQAHRTCFCPQRPGALRWKCRSLLQEDTRSVYNDETWTGEALASQAAPLCWLMWAADLVDTSWSLWMIWKMIVCLINMVPHHFQAGGRRLSLLSLPHKVLC